MKHVAIYARVSTDSQEEQRTIESQLAVLREVCQKNEVMVVNEYIDDGFSGATLTRPGLDLLRDDASKDVFQAVYILSPDRLARKYVYQALVIEELRKKDIEVIFMNKPVTDKPEDQLLLGIQGLISEYERAQIMERTRRGKLHRAKNGEIMGATPPYCYKYIPRDKNMPAAYMVNESEAEVVRLIFGLYLKSRSMRQVIRELANRDIRPRKQGKYWRTSSLYRVLKGEHYIGTAYYNKDQSHGAKRIRRDRSEWIPVKVPRILDEETFALVQKTLKEHHGGKRLRVYLLSGLVKCRYCGSNYGAVSSHRGQSSYYRCNNAAKRFPLPANCKAKWARTESFESAVVEAVKAAILNPDILAHHVLDQGANIRKSSKGRGEERQGLHRKKETLIAQEKKLLDLYLEGVVSKDEYQGKKLDIDLKVLRLESRLKDLSCEVPRIDKATIVESVNHFAAQAREKLEGQSPEELQQFLRYLIDEIVLDQANGKATVLGHVPATAAPTTSFRVPAITMAGTRNNILRFELTVAV